MSVGAEATRDVSGVWNCIHERGVTEQTWLIEQSGEDVSGGSLAAGGLQAPVSGSVSAIVVNLVAGPFSRRAAPVPGSPQAPEWDYTETFTGAISSDGNTMTGTWTSTAHEQGTWIASRLIAAPTGEEGSPTAP